MTKIFSFTVHVVASPATIFTKKTGGAFGRNAKKHENTTVLNKQKRTLCVFKCWLNCQMASCEALLSLEKKKTSPIQRHHAARSLFASCRTKPDVRQNYVISSVFFVSHRKNMIGKRNVVVTERCIFLGQKKRPRRTSPLSRVHCGRPGECFKSLPSLLGALLQQSFLCSSGWRFFSRRSPARLEQCFSSRSLLFPLVCFKTNNKSLVWDVRTPCRDPLVNALDLRDFNEFSRAEPSHRRSLPDEESHFLKVQRTLH